MRVVKIILGALLFGLGVAFIAMAAVNEVIDPAYFRSGFRTEIPRAGCDGLDRWRPPRRASIRNPERNLFP